MLSSGVLTITIGKTNGSLVSQGFTVLLVCQVLVLLVLISFQVFRKVVDKQDHPPPYQSLLGLYLWCLEH